MKRYDFEKLILGDWKEMMNGRWRENGPFKTYVRQEWKFIHDGKNAIKARTWKELALALGLIQGKKKVAKDLDKDTSSKRWIIKRVKSKSFANRL